MNENSPTNSAASRELIFEKSELIPEIFGVQDANLKQIEKKLNVRITTRENHIKIKGETQAVDMTFNLLSQLHNLLANGIPLMNGDVKFAIRLIMDDPNVDLQSLFGQRVFISQKKGYITPKGPSQREFIQCINEYDVVFGIGPAGTGKTYLAVAMAVEGLLKHQFKRIILVRPAVEAGEKLGFLPGDIAEKINPYLLPLYDALYDMIEYNRAQQMIEDNIIEVAPLAYMRGRTLSDAFIILDEGQNSTPEQMKMFLTRLGFHSKMVVTGDITQVDLPRESSSGLIQVQGVLKDIDGIRFVYFNEKDVVRHELVRKIVKAYDQKRK